MAKTSEQIYADLAAQFAVEDHKNKPKSGGQTYVPWNLIVERANQVLGFEQWSFRVIREGIIPSGTECWVLGEVTANVLGVATVRHQYGSCEMVAGSRPVDDIFKKAASDSLKKCLQVLGIALYLTDDEERGEVQAAMRAGVRTNTVDDSLPVRAAPQPPAQKVMTRDERIAVLKRGIAAGTAYGYDYSGVDETQMDLRQINEAIEEIADQIKKARAAGITPIQQAS